MARLRGLLEGLGYASVATYLQSGNAVVSTAEPPFEVARRVEEALLAIGGVTAQNPAHDAAPAVLVMKRPATRSGHRALP